MQSKDNKIKLTGPVTGGRHGWPFGAFFGDISQLGYVEEEYDMEGNAVFYNPTGALGVDGKWTLEPAGTAPYKTRFLVRRPMDAARFNGTVILEWANVSNGYEVSFCEAPGIYDGFAYVIVSAQPLGLNGFASNPRGLKRWDDARYGTLSIVDESISYDIFTQAAKAVGPNRTRAGVDPMDGLDVKKLIGVGASQSGSRILAYANGVQPMEQVFDGLIPVICAGHASDFDGTLAHPDWDAGNRNPSRSIPALVRDDLTAKVLQLNSQTEGLYYAGLRQPDTDSFRSWEVAGASHAPYRQMRLLYQKTDRDGMSDSMRVYPASRNSEVNWHYTLDAAYVHMQRWVNGGEAPPRFSPLEVNDSGTDYIYDEFGNAKGGIRLPEVEVPIANYIARSGLPLTGYTIFFPVEQLKALYPTHERYVKRVTEAAHTALEAGVILPYRVDDYIRMAETAYVPEQLIPEIEVNMGKF